MSEHDLHLLGDPSDLRHGKRPAEDGEQDNPFDQPEPAALRNPWGSGPDVPQGTFFRPADFVPRETSPVRAAQALQWHNGRGDTITDLAQFDWEYASNMPNVELRTIHAHLMEGIAKARQEMRVRGMVVDF